jgi:hypothetical protein
MHLMGENNDVYFWIYISLDWVITWLSQAMSVMFI